MSLVNAGINGQALSSLTGVQSGDTQPNAVDLRVAKVFEIDSSQPFIIDEDRKVHRGSKPLEADVIMDGKPYWRLEAGKSYEFIMENIVTVADGEAGWVITRSTLNRNGIFITSGLYDSGYSGSMAAVAHIRVGDAFIMPGTRVGQYVSVEAETLHSYDGDYGIGKEHDKKYAK